MFALRWRIWNDETQFGSDASYLSTSNQELDPIGEVFTPKRLPESDSSILASSISFTAESSINGYTIGCDDLQNESVNITIEGTYV